jgi:peptide/nickel transport system substrate-binding protein
MLSTALGVLVLVSILLAGCGKGGAAVPELWPGLKESKFEPMTVSGDCSNGTLIKSIEAVDEFTVKFTMCVPDPSFLSKIAFSPFAIYPKEWLEANTAVGSRLDKPLGTGPYYVSDWKRGESVTFTKFSGYWGTPAITDTLVFRWSTESAARLLELQSGTVDGIDNVGPDDFAVVQGDSNLQLMIRPAVNVFYIGMTNTFPPFDIKEVRQAVAMGIDRKRIVDTFYPAGSSVADFFTPCTIPNGCVGDKWYDFDPAKAKELLAAAGFPEGFKTKLFYRDVVRGYLPEVAHVAQEIQAQLKTNLNIDAEIVVMESGAFIDASQSGTLDGFHLLGWGADYPHVTNFLDYHFSGNKRQFGDPYPEIYNTLAEAAQIADPAQAESLYVKANNAIRDLVPMVPVAHGGNATAYRADVETPQASPLSNEMFAVSKPGDRTTFVFMQNAEPISLFCQDETDGESLRACEQVMQSLYSFEINGTAVEPALAEKCEPSADLKEWTCTLRKGVKFQNGFKLDADDVVTTFVAGIDSTSPLHVGDTNAYEYWVSLWGNLWGLPAPG